MKHLGVWILSILLLIAIYIVFASGVSEGFQELGLGSSYALQRAGVATAYTAVVGSAPTAESGSSTQKNFWNLVATKKGKLKTSTDVLLSSVMNPGPKDTFTVVFPNYISMYALAKYNYDPVAARQALLTNPGYDILQQELSTLVSDQAEAQQFAADPIGTSCANLRDAVMPLLTQLNSLRINMKDLSGTEVTAETLHNENIALQGSVAARCIATGSATGSMSPECIKLASQDDTIIDPDTGLVNPYSAVNSTVLTKGATLQDQINSILQAYNVMNCPVPSPGDMSATYGSLTPTFTTLLSADYLSSLGLIDTASLTYKLQELSPYYISPNVINFISRQLVAGNEYNAQLNTTDDLVKDISKVTDNILSITSTLPEGYEYDQATATIRQCPAGYVCYHTNSTPTPCPAGSYCPAGTVGTAPLCPSGSYSRTGATSIAGCVSQIPLGYYSLNGVQTICPTGSYCTLNTKTPTACPKGTYNDATGKSSVDDCKPCPAGGYCDRTGMKYPSYCPQGTSSAVVGAQISTVCKPCPAGKYCPSSASGALPCPAGTYSNVANATKCTPCDPGKYMPMTGATSAANAIACPAGSYCPGGGGAPVQCPAGRFCSGSGLSTPGQACPAGYYCPGGGAAAVPCPAGTYCPTPSLSAPLTCPPGDYCPGTSGSASLGNSFSQCAPGTYSLGGAGSGCTRCPAGSYCPSITALPIPCAPGSYSLGGATSCTVCPPGSYCPSTSSGPIPCQPGKYCPGGGSAQVNCPPGEFCPNSSGSTYSDCPVGTYSSSPDSVSCTQCPAGSYCPPKSVNPIPCDDGTYSAVNAGSCTACPPGSFCPSTSSGPQICPPGTYSAGNARACTPCPPGSFCIGGGISPSTCPAGTYCPSPGGSVALPCPVGMICSVQGGSQAQSCPPGQYCPTLGESSPAGTCPAGTYSLGGAGSSCTSCPRGSYCPTTTDAPTTCPAGTYNIYTDQTLPSSCIACPAGSFCQSTTSGPQSCLPGTYSAGNATSCSSCPPGTFCSGGGSVPTTCPVGTYCPSTSGSTALQCPIGAICPVPGGSRAQTCPPGQYCPTLGEGSTGLLCEPGTYSVGGATTSCTQCPVGQYVATSGASSCLPCPVGKFCTIGCSTPVASAPPGYAITNLADPASMYICPAGTYSSTTNASSCTNCAVGTYSINPGSTSCGTCPSNMTITIGTVTPTNTISLTTPTGIVVDSNGNLYVADRGARQILKFTKANGSWTGSVYAGTGTGGNADGTLSTSTFYSPIGMVIDTLGNIYVCDNAYHTIRMITPSGIVTTVIGTTSGDQGNTPSSGTIGSSAPSSTARLTHPTNMTIDANNNIYVIDQDYTCVKKITTTGATFTVTTIANSFSAAVGIACDANNNVYVTDVNTYCVYRINAAGTKIVFAGLQNTRGAIPMRFFRPSGIFITGNIGYIFDTSQDPPPQGGGFIRTINVSSTTIPTSITYVAGHTRSGDANGIGSAARFRFSTDNNTPNVFALDKTTNTLYLSENGSVPRIRSMVLDTPQVINVCTSVSIG